MKGLMATLLALGLTGMVSGQQTQSNSNSFDLQSAQNGNSTSLESQNNSKSAPLILNFNDQYIEEFTTKGFLFAPINPTDERTGQWVPLDAVNGILFTYGVSDDTSTAEIENNSIAVSPIGKQGTTLIFEFDDDEIRQIKSRGLHFRFGSMELGRFEQVKVIYKDDGLQQPTSQQQTSFQDPRSPVRQDRVDSNRPNDAFSNSNTSNVNAGRGNYNDRLREYDRNFVGPPAPAPIDPLPNSISRPNSDSLDRIEWSASPNPGNVQSMLGSSRSQQNPAYSNNGSIADRNSMPDRRGLGNDFANNPTNFNRNPNTDFPRGNPRTVTPSGQNLTELEQFEQDLALRESQAKEKQLALKQQEILDLEARNNETQYRRAEQIRADQVRAETARRTSPDSNGNNDQFVNSDPDRYASSRNPSYSEALLQDKQSNRIRSVSDQGPQPTDNGLDGFKSSIPAENKNPSNQSMTPVLYFMLLASLGLNIYLGWLTRGFYVRYSELADELRETFTATM